MFFLESDIDDPFSKTYDPDFNCSSDQIEDEQRYIKKLYCKNNL